MRLHIITCILLIIGGLNWLLQGLLSWEIGQIFGGQEALISRIIYILVGIAAIIELFSFKKSCFSCCKSGTPIQPIK